MGNFWRDIQGTLVSYLHLPSGPVLWNICCFFASLLCKGCKRLGTHKERALALFFFVVEAISVVLDLIGKNKEVFLLSAFLLSAFGFAITLYACVEEENTNTKTLAERQLKAIEIVFSVIQLIVTFVQFLLTVLQVNNSYNASAFPLAFAMIAIVFIFKRGRNIDDHSPPKDFHLPLVNLQPIDSVSNSPIELDLTGTSSPNPVSSSLERSAHASDDHPVNHKDVLSKHIEVFVPEYGVERAIDLMKLKCYKELYKELKNMLSIRLYFNKRPKSHWELIYEDHNAEMLLVGNDSWEDFYHNVRKLYLYKRKSLRKNYTVEPPPQPPQMNLNDFSPPSAPLPVEQQTIMGLVTACDPLSSLVIDIDIEGEKTAPPPPPPPASVSLDLLEDDSEEGLMRFTLAEIEASDVTRPKKKPRLITSDLVLLVPSC